jgi:hypothetical protein
VSPWFWCPSKVLVCLALVSKVFGGGLQQGAAEVQHAVWPPLCGVKDWTAGHYVLVSAASCRVVACSRAAAPATGNFNRSMPLGVARCAYGFAVGWWWFPCGRPHVPRPWCCSSLCTHAAHLFLSCSPSAVPFQLGERGGRQQDVCC